MSFLFCLISELNPLCGLVPGKKKAGKGDNVGREYSENIYYIAKTIRKWKDFSLNILVA